MCERTPGKASALCTTGQIGTSGLASKEEGQTLESGKYRSVRISKVSPLERTQSRIERPV